MRKRLGEMLIEAGVIEQPQLQLALAHQRKWGGKLGQALVDLKVVTEPQIVAALSQKLRYEVADVAAVQRTPEVEEALKLVPAEVALRHTVLPIAADVSAVTVVMSDPSNIAVVDELAFRTGRRIKICLAGDRALQAAVQRFYLADDERRRGGVALPRASPAPVPPATASSPAPSAAPVLAPVAAAAPIPQPHPRRDGPVPARPLTARDAALLESVHRACRGEETMLVKPAQLSAAAVRVLLRKGLVTEAELVDELSKPER